MWSFNDPISRAFARPPQSGNGYVIGRVVFSPNFSPKLLDLGKKDIWFDTEAQKYTSRLDQEKVKDALMACIDHLKADGVPAWAIKKYVDTALSDDSER